MAEDLKIFLSFLAVEKRVAAATQRLAFNAVLFLYRNILRIEINGLSTVVPARVPKKLPVVLTREEIQEVFSRFGGDLSADGQADLRGGLRLEECLTLARERYRLRKKLPDHQRRKREQGP